MKRYDSTPKTTRYDGKQVYRTTHYPQINPSDSDTVVITDESDYLDALANKYYQDPTLWWIIALANNLIKGRLSVPAGMQLRIPANVNDILVRFHNLNKE